MPKGREKFPKGREKSKSCQGWWLSLESLDVSVPHQAFGEGKHLCHGSNAPGMAEKRCKMLWKLE